MNKLYYNVKSDLITKYIIHMKWIIVCNVFYRKESVVDVRIFCR